MTGTLLRAGRRALVFAAAVCLSTATAHAQRMSVAAPLVLRPGDALKLTVWESPSFSGEFEIAPDGTLRHPLLNRVVVTGIPLDSVRGRIVAFLSEYQREPAIDIAPLVRIVVTGEVRTPGVYLVPPEMSVADAVVKAGSPTISGKERRVSLERGGRERSFDPGDGDLEPQWRTVQSGDRITVPRRSTRSIRGILVPLLQYTAAFGSAYLSAYLVIISRREQE